MTLSGHSICRSHTASFVPTRCMFDVSSNMDDFEKSFRHESEYPGVRQIKSYLQDYTTDRVHKDQEHRRSEEVSSALVKLEPGEFTTLNIGDLGSKLLHSSRHDNGTSPVSNWRYSSEDRYPGSLVLPLQQPMVDIKEEFPALNSKTFQTKKIYSNEECPNGYSISSLLSSPWVGSYDAVLKEVPKMDFEKCSQNLIQSFKSENVISNTTCNQRDSNDNSTKETKRPRRPRKMRTPIRSPESRDPCFKGATIILHTEMKNRACRLKISAHFSNVKTYKGLLALPRKRKNSESMTDSVSGSDEENTIPFPRETYYSAKTCASCNTRRTPLWRDADDGTPLCNACGISHCKICHDTTSRWIERDGCCPFL